MSQGRLPGSSILSFDLALKDSQIFLKGKTREHNVRSEDVLGQKGEEVNEFIPAHESDGAVDILNARTEEEPYDRTGNACEESSGHRLLSPDAPTNQKIVVQAMFPEKLEVLAGYLSIGVHLKYPITLGLSIASHQCGTVASVRMPSDSQS